jgi:transposase-like protein
MAKILEREKARVYRHKGKSIAEIAKSLDVSKSTVSYWCRDIVLSSQQIKQLQLKSRHAGTKQFIRLGEQRGNRNVASALLVSLRKGRLAKL